MGLNDLGASAPVSVQREAVRILEVLISGSDVVPLTDGTTRVSFECSGWFFDRLALWASAARAAESCERGDDGGIYRVPGDLSQANDAPLAVAEGQGNVIASADMLHTHAVRTGAREALALLMADVQPGGLPGLSPRSPAERVALRGEDAPQASASQAGPILPLTAAV